MYNAWWEETRGQPEDKKSLRGKGLYIAEVGWMPCGSEVAGGVTLGSETARIERGVEHRTPAADPCGQTISVYKNAQRSRMPVFSLAEEEKNGLHQPLLPGPA